MPSQSSWTSAVAGAPHFASVEWLRAFAAFGVMWYHFTLPRIGYDLPLWVQESSQIGKFGVQIFFVISGFVIPWMLWRINYRVRDHLFGFMLRRFVRLEPAYFAAIALAIAILFVRSLAPWKDGLDLDVSPTLVVMHLFYLPPLFGEPWLNTVFWTLCVEFQFYFLIAFAYPSIASPKRFNRVFCLVALCAVGFLPFPDDAVTTWGPVFALGLIVFHDRTRLESGALNLLYGAVAVCLIGWLHDWFMAGVCCVTALIIARVRLPAVRLVQGFAGMSYSLYLIHHMIGLTVINMGMRFFDFPGADLVTLVCAISAAVLSAAVFHRIVEAPTRLLSRTIPWDIASIRRLRVAAALDSKR